MLRLSFFRVRIYEEGFCVSRGLWQEDADDIFIPLRFEDARDHSIASRNLPFSSGDIAEEHNLSLLREYHATSIRKEALIRSAKLLLEHEKLEGAEIVALMSQN